jgi:HTH-type transcriptional regulator/antitoxin HipB
LTVRTIRDLAGAVRGRRIDLGISQAELASRAGVSRKWIYEFEAGKAAAEFGLILRVIEALNLVLEMVPSNDASGAGGGAIVDLDVLIDEHRAR